MNDKLVRVTFPCKYDADLGLIIGYASKEVVDLGNDLVPAEVWFEALGTFFQEGAPVKLLHRPSLVVGETVWLKIVSDGLVLASRPLYPEIKGLIERGLLRGYSIGYWPLEVEEREDGVRVLKKLELVEVSLVDVPMNQECYFSEVKDMLRPGIEVHFDPATGIVTAKGLTKEEMARLAELLGQSLEGAGVKDLSCVKAIAFKMAEEDNASGGEARNDQGVEGKEVEGLETPESIASEVKALMEEKGISEEEAAWDLALTYYYKMFDGEPIEEEKARWTRAFINRLPNAAFAVIEPAYLRGETENKNARHLPHHGPNVRNPNEDSTVDLPHYRNALARVTLIKPITDSISREELVRRAQRHLEVHRDVLKTESEKVLDALRELASTLGPEILPQPGKEEVKTMEELKKEELREDEVKQAETPVAEEKTEEKAEEKALDIEGKLAELEGLKSLPEKLEIQEKSLGELMEKVARLEDAVSKIVDALSSLSPKASSLPVVDTREGKEERKGWGLGLDKWAKAVL